MFIEEPLITSLNILYNHILPSVLLAVLLMLMHVEHMLPFRNTRTEQITKTIIISNPIYFQVYFL